jgi:hypothetical protein
MVHEINEENYLVAISAIRDILYMYYDLVESYNGFGHNINTGEFDPIFFADCYLFEREGMTLGIDVNILHEGSTVAILCKLSDYRDESGVLPDNEFVSQVRRTLSEGRLDHLPLAERAIKEAFENEENFRGLLGEIYENYVVGQFRKLSGH